MDVQRKTFKEHISYKQAQQRSDQISDRDPTHLLFFSAIFILGPVLYVQLPQPWISVNGTAGTCHGRGFMA
jgi:hypothetical protein